MGAPEYFRSLGPSGLGSSLAVAMTGSSGMREGSRNTAPASGSLAGGCWAMTAAATKRKMAACGAFIRVTLDCIRW